LSGDRRDETSDCRGVAETVPGLVSVVIVAHNNWPELELAIASALQQTYPCIEVLVIDNDSRDQTAEEVQARFGSRVRYFRQANTGDGGGYNRGIRESCGEFVHLLDGDDVLAPTAVAIQAAYLEAHPDIDAVYGDMRCFHNSVGGQPPRNPPGRAYNDFLDAIIRGEDGGAVTPTTTLFRRIVFQSTGYFIERNGSWDDIWWQVDREFLVRAAVRGCRFAYVPGALLFYRISDRQMSADTEGMNAGMEVFLERSFECLPLHKCYRETLARTLAAFQFSRALNGQGMSRIAALRKIWRAHQLAPDRVTLFRAIAGAIVIIVPMGRRLARTYHQFRAQS
jgi:alpha-1,6-rhamnosyltransferase